MNLCKKVWSTYAYRWTSSSPIRASALLAWPPFPALSLRTLWMTPLELQPTILFNKNPIREFFKFFLWQVLWIAASLEKKTAITTFLNNFRSSRPEMFFKIGVQNIWEKSQENIQSGVFWLVKSKRIYYHRSFPGNFLQFFTMIIL